MPEILDVFRDDAFSVRSLTATINQVDHIPSRAGELVFEGLAEGAMSENVAIERDDESIALIQSTPRGAPAERTDRDGRDLIPLTVPHFKTEATIRADQVSAVRQMGMAQAVQTVQSVVNQRFRKMQRRHDLTLEHVRLGALRGIILDADGSTLINLYTALGLQAPAAINFGLDDNGTDVRLKCMEARRTMTQNAKLAIPSSAAVWALCGAGFFDKLISHPTTKAAYDGWQAAERRLGGGYAYDVFYHGNIFFEDYRGTDDNTTVAITDDECRLFWTGVPGMYEEWYAPATYLDEVNTIGLPRYARQAPDNRFNEAVELQVQMNPLPLCLRPRTLLRGTSQAD